MVEGKAPYVHVSAHVAEIIDEKAQYIKNRGFDDGFYKKLILEYLGQFSKGTKADFVKLLSDKLPDVLSVRQKDDKVRNYLAALRREGIVEYNGKWLFRWLGTACPRVVVPAFR